MIFEELERHGGEIVSVSEAHIHNSLTGKLIRSILAWSAESEREKIVEYANRPLVYSGANRVAGRYRVSAVRLEMEG